jgi:hypothetical protein
MAGNDMVLPSSPPVSARRVRGGALSMIAAA